MIHFHDLHPALNNLKADILAGLKSEQKTIAPKYFYDNQGSLLFDRICQLPEYYLTRTEINLLKQYGVEMADFIGPDTILFELGSGSSHKIRLLLEAIRPSSYVPLDISKDHLFQSANLLANDYPWLEVHAICVDYAGAWNLPAGLKGKNRTAFFPGSSVGNLASEDAVDLLSRIARLVGDDGGLLIGVDLIKDIDQLEAAYNDSNSQFKRINIIFSARDWNVEAIKHKFHQILPAIKTDITGERP